MLVQHCFLVYISRGLVTLLLFLSKDQVTLCLYLEDSLSVLDQTQDSGKLEGEPDLTIPNNITKNAVNRECHDQQKLTYLEGGCIFEIHSVNVEWCDYNSCFYMAHPIWCFFAADLDTNAAPPWVFPFSFLLELRIPNLITGLSEW